MRGSLRGDGHEWTPTPTHAQGTLSGAHPGPAHLGGPLPPSVWVSLPSLSLSPTHTRTHEIWLLSQKIEVSGCSEVAEAVRSIMCSLKLKGCYFRIAASGHLRSRPGSELETVCWGKRPLGSGPQCLFLELVRKVTTRLSAPLKSAGPFPKGFLLLLFSEWALCTWTRLCGLLGEPWWKGMGAGGMGAARQPRRAGLGSGTLSLMLLPEPSVPLL